MTDIYMKIAELLVKYSKKTGINLSKEEMSAISLYYAKHILLPEGKKSDVVDTIEKKYLKKPQSQKTKKLKRYNKQERAKRRIRSEAARKAVNDYSVTEVMTLRKIITDDTMPSLEGSREFVRLYNKGVYYKNNLSEVQKQKIDYYNNNVAMLFHKDRAKQYEQDLIINNHMTWRQANLLIKKERGDLFYNYTKDYIEKLDKFDEMLSDEVPEEKFIENAGEILDLFEICAELQNVMKHKDLTFSNEQRKYLTEHVDKLLALGTTFCKKIYLMANPLYEYVDLDRALEFDSEKITDDYENKIEAEYDSYRRESKAIDELKAKENKTQTEQKLLDFMTYCRHVRETTDELTTEDEKIQNESNALMNTDCLKYMGEDITFARDNCKERLYQPYFAVMEKYRFNDPDSNTKSRNSNKYKHKIDDLADCYVEGDFTDEENDNEESYGLVNGFNYTTLDFTDLKPIAFVKGDRAAVLTYEKANYDEVKTTYNKPETLFNYLLKEKSKEFLKKITDADNVWMRMNNWARTNSNYDEIVDAIRNISNMEPINLEASEAEKENQLDNAMNLFTRLHNACVTYINYKNTNHKGTVRENARIKAVKETMYYAASKIKEIRIIHKAKETMNEEYKYSTISYDRKHELVEVRNSWQVLKQENYENYVKYMKSQDENNYKNYYSSVAKNGEDNIYMYWASRYNAETKIPEQVINGVSYSENEISYDESENYKNAVTMVGSMIVAEMFLVHIKGMDDGIDGNDGYINFMQDFFSRKEGLEYIQKIGKQVIGKTLTDMSFGKYVDSLDDGLLDGYVYGFFRERFNPYDAMKDMDIYKDFIDKHKGEWNQYKLESAFRLKDHKDKNLYEFGIKAVQTAQLNKFYEKLKSNEDLSKEDISAILAELVYNSFPGSDEKNWTDELLFNHDEIVKQIEADVNFKEMLDSYANEKNVKEYDLPGVINEILIGDMARHISEELYTAFAEKQKINEEKQNEKLNENEINKEAVIETISNPLADRTTPDRLFYIMGTDDIIMSEKKNLDNKKVKEINSKLKEYFDISGKSKFKFTAVDDNTQFDSEKAKDIVAVIALRDLLQQNTSQNLSELAEFINKKDTEALVAIMKNNAQFKKDYDKITPEKLFEFVTDNRARARIIDGICPSYIGDLKTKEFEEANLDGKLFIDIKNIVSDHAHFNSVISMTQRNLSEILKREREEKDINFNLETREKNKQMNTKIETEQFEAASKIVANIMLERIIKKELYTPSYRINANGSRTKNSIIAGKYAEKPEEMLDDLRKCPAIRKLLDNLTYQNLYSIVDSAKSDKMTNNMAKYLDKVTSELELQMREREFESNYGKDNNLEKDKEAMGSIIINTILNKEYELVKNGENQPFMEKIKEVLTIDEITNCLSACDKVKKAIDEVTPESLNNFVSNKELRNNLAYVAQSDVKFTNALLEKVSQKRDNTQKLEEELGYGKENSDDIIYDKPLEGEKLQIAKEIIANTVKNLIFETEKSEPYLKIDKNDITNAEFATCMEKSDRLKRVFNNITPHYMHDFVNSNEMKNTFAVYVVSDKKAINAAVKYAVDKKERWDAIKTEFTQKTDEDYRRNSITEPKSKLKLEEILH